MNTIQKNAQEIMREINRPIPNHTRIECLAREIERLSTGSGEKAHGIRTQP
ncbi:MAG: hypothetical protein PQJ59_01690 [Spirochaetales bacterium]|nr:hypothetical protein [Spirochaetales bacterium]